MLLPLLSILIFLGCNCGEVVPFDLEDSNGGNCSLSVSMESPSFFRDQAPEDEDEDFVEGEEVGFKSVMAPPRGTKNLFCRAGNPAFVSAM